MDRGRDVMTTVEAINACIPLNNPELTGQLGSLSEIVHYKKGDCIYDIGDIQKKVYVLIEGMLRCYFIDESQTEMTDSFMTEKGMVANSVEIFVGKETPSVIGVEVLNETTVLEIPVQAVFDLMQQYPRMAKLYVRCLHQALEFQNEINIKRLYLPGNLYCFRNSDIDCAWMPIFVEIFGVPVRRLSTPILVFLCYSL